MAVFRAEIQIKAQPFPVVRPLLASHQCLLDIPIERNLYITGTWSMSGLSCRITTRQSCQPSLHISPKDSLISLLTLESAFRQAGKPDAPGPSAATLLNARQVA